MSRKQPGKRSKTKSAVKRAPARPAVAIAPDPEIESRIASPGLGDNVDRNLRGKVGTAFAVIVMLVLHYALAAQSLLQENPTVDEVVHLPAGITYWQKGTFRLYHHNPPLTKLVAALPVLWAGPITERLYQMPSWKNPDPDQSVFSQTFAALNVDRYFELFRLARLMIPLFSIVGALAVFQWSRRLYGTWGGLLSLTLWVFCPNILAHARLVTSDATATALGVAATYVFWRYLHEPSWRWATASGLMLGVAQLSKFTMVLLYAVWPFLWLVRLVLVSPRVEWPERITRGVGHGILIVGLSIVTIDAGYFFEEVGTPLGKFEFGSRVLTRPVPPEMKRPYSKNPILAACWQFRLNRFRGSWMARVPCPLPTHYVLGFDEQKIEAEGIPQRFLNAISSPDEAVRDRAVAAERLVPESAFETRGAYPVYLNGELRRTGWWYYYLLTLVYKVPEGTWLLVILSFASLRFVGRTSSEWADEIALYTVPAVILFSMSVLTDINLGLRYVLAILPFVFIATGKLAPWMLALSGPRKWVMCAVVAGSLGSTVISTVWIHPHYLAYFNWASGGPDRAPARLIDSNLDWGQDLVTLQKWWKKTIPDEPLGLAYFGQINPSIFKLRGERFDWFLPPVKPGTAQAVAQNPSARLVGPAPKLTPGYYAVSATLLYGLPWRLYDPAPPLEVPTAWAPAWRTGDGDAFWYFRQFQPEIIIGHSIYVYHLSAADVAGAEPLFMANERK